MVLCSLMQRNDNGVDNPEASEESELPEKFRKLEKFFDDLKTDFGQRCIFDDFATETLLDLFILATRWVGAGVPGTKVCTRGMCRETRLVYRGTRVGTDCEGFGLHRVSLGSALLDMSTPLELFSLH